MAIALVAHGIQQGTANGSGNLTLDTTGANLVVLFQTSYAAAGEPTPAENKGNGSPTGLTAKTGGSQRGRFWYWINPTCGSSHVFSSTGTGTYPSIAVLAFSGADTSAPFDVQNGATGSAFPLATGSITPSVDGEVLVYGVTDNATGTGRSVDIGAVDDQAGYVFAVAWGLALAHEIQTTATARNPTFSGGTATQLAAVIAGFKAGASPKGLPIIAEHMAVGW